MSSVALALAVAVCLCHQNKISRWQTGTEPNVLIAMQLYVRVNSCQLQGRKWMKPNSMLFTPPRMARCRQIQNMTLRQLFAVSISVLNI